MSAKAARQQAVHSSTLLLTNSFTIDTAALLSLLLITPTLQDHLEFYVFDVPVPDTARFNVHYTIRGTASLDAVTEQSRVYLKDPWGNWDHKLAYYAYPASVVLIE
jgi:hypothetical protein